MFEFHDLLLFFSRVQDLLIPLGLWSIFLSISQFGYRYAKEEDVGEGWVGMTKWMIGRMAILTSLFVGIATLYIFVLVLNTSVGWILKRWFGVAMLGNTVIPEIADTAGVFATVVMVFMLGMLYEGIKRRLQKKGRIPKNKEGEKKNDYQI